MGPSRGFQSTTWKLHLSCEPAGSAPATVVLKSETSNPAFNAFSRLHNAFGREVGVYTHCVPRLKDHQPIIDASQGSEPCWLLMEDLTHLRAGDQLLGLSHAETLTAVQRMAALRCITTGVAMHGFMQDPDTTIRTALFMDQAIQHHAALAEELAAWEALPDSSGFCS